MLRFRSRLPADHAILTNDIIRTFAPKRPTPYRDISTGIRGAVHEFMSDGLRIQKGEWSILVACSSDNLSPPKICAFTGQLPLYKISSP